ncbi:MAG: hypothetical protein IIX74_01410 [Lachnospiraceae bacterium]|nr:hypothetical protein [Lachnospiraceae bacterium]
MNKKRTYTLIELSTMSGTTLRTLRSDIKSGLLLGTKDSGKWIFTEDDLNLYFSHPEIRQRIRSKIHAPAFLFLEALGHPKPSTCLIHDVQDKAEAERLNAVLAAYAKTHTNGNMSYTYFYDDEKRCGRFIMTGTTMYIREAIALLQ